MTSIRQIRVTLVLECAVGLTPDGTDTDIRLHGWQCELDKIQQEVEKYEAQLSALATGANVGSHVRVRAHVMQVRSDRLINRLEAPIALRLAGGLFGSDPIDTVTVLAPPLARGCCHNQLYKSPLSMDILHDYGHVVRRDIANPHHTLVTVERGSEWFAPRSLLARYVRDYQPHLLLIPRDDDDDDDDGDDNAGGRWDDGSRSIGREDELEVLDHASAGMWLSTSHASQLRRVFAKRVLTPLERSNVMAVHCEFVHEPWQHRGLLQSLRRQGITAPPEVPQVSIFLDIDIVLLVVGQPAVKPHPLYNHHSHHRQAHD